MKKFYYLLLILFTVNPVAHAAIKCKSAGQIAPEYFCVLSDKHLLSVRSFGLPRHQDTATVIFQPGGGNTMETWDKVAPKVAKFAHVITYDRSGFGRSQNYSPLKPLTAEVVTQNLKILLRKLKLPPPYILVGHSNGGLTMQYFALKNPEMVRGLILVDSSSVQLLNWKMFNPLRPDPKLNQAFYYEALGITPTLKSLQKIYVNKPAAAFANLPIAVLTSTNHKKIKFFTPEKEILWQEYQRQLPKLSHNSYQIYAYNTGHFIQDEQPNLVINAIYTMIAQTEKGNGVNS